MSSYTFYNKFWNFGNPTNLRQGSNPPYAVTDFIAFSPQFGNDVNGNPIVPTSVIQMYIDEATARLQQARFRSSWSRAMGLFVSHYCTLYLQTYVDPSNGADAVAEAGRTQGVSTSQSVGDVSESVDLSSVLNPAWGDLNLTTYGIQLGALSQIYGKGGMGVW